MGEPLPLAGRYRFARRFGADRSAIVWFAIDDANNRQVVVSLVAGPRAEVLKKAVGVKHAHLASILEILPTPSQSSMPPGVTPQGSPLAVVAEHVAGEALYARINEGAMVRREGVQCVASLASALHALHQRSVVHGSFSPLSVVVARPDGGTVPVLTQALMPPLPAFASPERANGGRASALDDVWALHATLYAVLTGRPPLHIEAGHFAFEHAPLDNFGEPDELLEGILRRGLSVSPKGRTSSAEELGDNLTMWLARSTAREVVASRAARRVDARAEDAGSSIRVEKVEAAIVDRGRLSDPGAAPRRGDSTAPPPMEKARRGDSAAPPPIEKRPIASTSVPPVASTSVPPPTATSVAPTSVASTSVNPTSVASTSVAPPAASTSIAPVAPTSVASSAPSLPPGADSSPARPAAPARPSSAIIAAASLILVVIVAVLVTRSRNRPPEPSSSPPTQASITAQPSITTQPSIAPLETATPAATTSAAIPGEPPTARPVVPSVTRERDPSMCVAQSFPEGSFAIPQDLAFVCEPGDARSIVKRISTRLIVAGANNATPATKEWARLEWYELAAFAVLRGTCCPGAPPIELPPSDPPCEHLGPTLDKLAAAVAERRDIDLRVLGFDKNIVCLNAQLARPYRYTGHPYGGAQVVFAGFLKRNTR